MTLIDQSDNSPFIAAPPQSATRPTDITATAEIAQAIAAVMQEIDVVVKRGENTFHRYRYARIEDVLRQLTPLLGKHGIVIFQDETGRSMFDGDAVIAITYQFTVAHKSGEVWPEKLRQTGVSRCRDSKGGWDDKSVNKCHTAARKYFLLSLFQIPTSEIDDADREASSRPTRQNRKEDDDTAARAKAWLTQFLAGIRRATNEDNLNQWMGDRQTALDRLAEVSPDKHSIAVSALARRRAELKPSIKNLPPTISRRALETVKTPRD